MGEPLRKEGQCPRPTPEWQDHPDNDPDRVDRLNELFDEEIYRRPRFVRLDIAGWLRFQPGGEFDPRIRGDVAD